MASRGDDFHEQSILALLQVEWYFGEFVAEEARRYRTHVAAIEQESETYWDGIVTGKP
jgi:hypothetical protein